MVRIDSEQLELIDVDDPAYKAVKTHIKQYEKMKEEHQENHAADRAKETEKRHKVLEAIVDAKIKPDAEGAYHFKFEGREWIVRQDSQLKIQKHAIAAKETDDAAKESASPVAAGDAHEEEGNEPAARSHGRRGR